MIECFEGRIGGGKSYSAVVRLVAHLAEGGTVCTNIDLHWKAICDYVANRWKVFLEEDQLIHLSDEQVSNFHHYTPSGTVERSVLCVLDEAHLNFNSRDWSQTSRDLLAFLTQSRKTYTDIIFISQSVLNMDKQFMRLVQYVWRFRDMSKWRIPALGIKWPLNQILACQFDYDGRTILNRQFIGKEKKVFALYDTNAIVRPFKRLEDVKTNRKLKKVEKGKKMGKVLIPAAIVIGIISAFMLFSRFKSIGKPVAPKEKVVGHSEFGVVGSAAAKDRRAYDIYAEKFVRFTSRDATLGTDRGQYAVGQMSSHGFVLAVSPRRAKIAQPDGRTGWVVAEEVEQAGGVLPAKARVPAEDQTGQVSAPSDGNPPDDVASWPDTPKWGAATRAALAAKPSGGIPPLDGGKKK